MTNPAPTPAFNTSTRLEALDRAERIAQEADQPDPFAGHPELPLATSNQHPIPGINCDINGKLIQP
jgi:hypothetical protein